MDPKDSEKTDQPETKPPRKDVEEAADPAEPDGLLDLVRKHEKLIALLLAVPVALGAIFGIAFGLISYVQGKPDQPPSERFLVPAPSGPLNLVSQVKPNGVKAWAGTVTILPEEGRVRFRLRVENTSSRPLTGLVAKASLPSPITAMPDKCWRRSGDCEGSVVDEGVPLPSLQAEDWDSVVFVSEVSEEIRGGRYVVMLSISSDQTGELLKGAEVVVSASGAENAVRPFFQAVEETLKVGSHPVEMAQHSKRLLIGQWQEMTLEHPHDFDRVLHAKASLGGTPIGIDDLHYERLLEGRVVKVRARVLERPIDYRVNGEFVKQKVELGSPGESTRLRCYSARNRDHLLVKGDEVEVKAVVVAWGPPDSPYAELTVAVCPAIRVLRRRR